MKEREKYMKPVIGISMQYHPELPRYDMSAEYARAVAAVGGIPLLLPELEEEKVAQLLQLCQGVIFSGGEDVNPACYGREKEALCGRVTDHRDAAELLLFRLATERKLPVLGICRGVQLLNVALGGTLIQDIPGHRDTTHPVKVEGGSLLHSATGDCCRVNSYHHQVIEKPGNGLRVVARNEEGYIEAVELPDYPFFLGVQWHPERSLVREADPISRQILQMLINAAQKYN